jgi:hypothetical protein
MREIRTVTTEKSKRDNITRAIAAHDKKLNQARADLAQINTAIRIIALGKRPGCLGATTCSRGISQETSTRAI